jgi:hypothetical protein
MADETLSPSLGFLTDAAHLLSTTAPEISAHIMTQRNALMFSSKLTQSDAQRQHVCGCCGHIMIPGKGSVLKLEGRKVMRRRGPRKDVQTVHSSSEPARVQKQMTCGMCGQYTNMNVPSAPPIIRRAKPQPAQGTSRPGVSKNLDAPAPVVTKVSANASSKKRAKNRKQGLQALLAQSQTSASKGSFGLSLTDFMKK